MSINLKMIFLMDLPLLLIPVDVHLTQIPGIMPRRSLFFSSSFYPTLSTTYPYPPLSSGLYSTISKGFSSAKGAAAAL
jgi:hypothetical protein